LIGGVSVAANASFSGVYVAMHLDESDDAIALHWGTRVRKNHTSRRDAFQSVGVPLAAIWRHSGIEQIAPDLPKKGGGAPFRPATRFDGNVALLKIYPSMPGALISAVGRMGARGLIIEGTGLGHTNSKDIVAIKAFVKRGGLVCMTSQCVNGRVDLNVYDTGRDLVRAGVVPLEDMLAETALVKAMWALGNSATAAEAKAKMLENLVGEMTPRRFPG
jgi:glutamyl-tRNA(Gln) amidotransferase subunit D